MPLTPEEIEQLEARKRARNARILNGSRERMAIVQNTDTDNVDMPPEYYERLRREEARRASEQAHGDVLAGGGLLSGPAALQGDGRAGMTSVPPEFQQALTHLMSGMFAKSTALPRWMVIVFAVLDHLLRVIYFVLSTAGFYAIAQENHCFSGRFAMVASFLERFDAPGHARFPGGAPAFSLARTLWDGVFKANRALCSRLGGFRLFCLSEAAFLLIRGVVCYASTRRVFSLASRHVRRGFLSRVFCVLIPMAAFTLLCFLN